MTPRSSCPGGESTPLQGANLRLNYEINNVTDTALGNLARGKPSFCRSDRCLSYRPPGSLLESRGGSILAHREVPSRSAISGSRRPRVDCASTSRIVSARFTAGGSCFESLQCAPVIRNNLPHIHTARGHRIVQRPRSEADRVFGHYGISPSVGPRVDDEVAFRARDCHQDDGSPVDSQPEPIAL